MRFLLRGELTWVQCLALASAAAAAACGANVWVPRWEGWVF